MIFMQLMIHFQENMVKAKTTLQTTTERNKGRTMSLIIGRYFNYHIRKEMYIYKHTILQDCYSINQGKLSNLQDLLVNMENEATCSWIIYMTNDVKEPINKRLVILFSVIY